MVDPKKPMGSVGIRLDVLRSVMDEIDSNDKLGAIFGSPVCSKLGIVAAGDDLLILEGADVKLTDEERKVFQRESKAAFESAMKKAAK